MHHKISTIDVRNQAYLLGRAEAIRRLVVAPPGTVRRKPRRMRQRYNQQSADDAASLR